MDFESDHIVALARRMESEFALRARHPERGAIYADYAARSARFRDAWPGYERLWYAQLERCAIDWFPPQAAPGGEPWPLLVFIHGGYWRALDMSTFSFIAENYVKAGVAVALIEYELAPKVSLSEICDQARAAVSWLAGQAKALHFAPNRVSVSGSSAGGHLTAIVAASAPDLLGGHELVSAIPISGVFTLEPLLLTSINLDVRMTPDEAVRQSPAHMGRFHADRFLVAVGGRETEGFTQQSREFHQKVLGTGGASEFLVVPDRTHFDILEDFSRPEDAFFQQTLALVKGRA